MEVDTTTYTQANILRLHKKFPNVGTSIIENELRRNGGDLKAAKRVIKGINDSIAGLDDLEDGAGFKPSTSNKRKADGTKDSNADIDQDMEVDEAKNQSSSDSEDSYQSQDEDEQDEIDEICSQSNTIRDGKSEIAFDPETTQSIHESIAKDLNEKFTLVPYPCIVECVSYFYPNMGKIEHVLSQFENHFINYSKDFEGYKKGKKERRKREYKKKEGKTRESINPELESQIDSLMQQLNSDMNDLSKDQKRELKGQIKDLKRQLKIEKKSLKKQQKEQRKKLKSEAKEVKCAERAVKKQERDDKRLEETKARSQKDYEDDVFFREVRKEPSIIKQYLKDAKRNLRKASKLKNEEEIVFYTKQMEELEAQLGEKEDEAIMATYERYNKSEEAASRLDLHGLKKREALRLLDKIVALRIKQINEKYGEPGTREPFEFNIVTGRGGHSNGRSVLKPAAKDYLIDHGIEYREFKNGAGYIALL